MSYLIKTTISINALRSRFFIFILGLIFYGILLYCYISYIVPREEYMGLVARLLPLECWGVSVVMFLLPLLWLPIDFKRPSDYASWLLYLSVVGPTSLISFMVSDRDPLQVIWIPATMLFGFVLFEVVRCGRLFKLPVFTGTLLLFEYLLPIAMVILSIATVAITNFNIDLSFESIYARRLEASEMVSARSLMAYVPSLLVGFFIPLSIIFGFRYKKWLHFLLAAFAMLAVFSLEGKKTVIVLPAIIFSILFMESKLKRNQGMVLLATGIVVIALALLFERFMELDVITIYLVRRVFVVPAQLTTYYFDFFSKNPHMLMTDSYLGYFFESPYSLRTPNLIGYVMFGMEDKVANAGIWASGFAHFGYVGVVLMSLFAGIAFRAVDSMAKGRGFMVVSAFSALIGLLWAEQAMHTSMLTSGVAFLILALFIFPTTLPINLTKEFNDR
jgi:hypothetical protein